MPIDLPQLLAADTDHAVQIADRVWWVGHVLADDLFQCHSYLIEQGDESVLLDPGSRLTFPGTLRKIEEIIPFTRIRWFICHHPDPDITASLPLIDALNQRDDAALVTHWRSRALLKHLGIELAFWLVEEHDWRLSLEDRSLRFVFTPYAHFPGAICSFDERTGVLFSSDLFGGFTEEGRLVAEDESYLEAVRPFHEHYMPSRDIFNYALARIEPLAPRMIAPQHGSIVPGPLVGFMIEQLRQIECGIYLLSRDDSDIRRLFQLSSTLREMTEIMLRYRDFREIATRLLAQLRRALPATQMDYFAALDDGRILSLTQASRYVGLIGQEPDPVCRLIGDNRGAWVDAHRGGGRLKTHRLHGETLCEQTGDDGGLVITLPLSAPGQEQIDAVVVIHVDGPGPIAEPVSAILTQIAEPLHVAIEREVIHRRLDMERERAYQRSIRDSLTGLYTRFYMHDVMQRYCAVQDRDPSAAIAAIMIDMDHFKGINDRHGHLIGDRVLARVGGILVADSRDSDVPVRFGGEEMMLFMVGQTADSAAEVAERLRLMIAAQRFDDEGAPELRVSASLGVALRGRGEPLEGLIRRADEALYRAKMQGRNRVCTAD